MRFFLVIILLALAIPAKAGTVKIVASFSILGDLARQVAGDNVEVVTLVGPDGDPHGFEPRPSDARKLAGADVLIVNGLGFDNWADRLARAAGFHGRRIVTTAGIRPISGGGAPDPHAWQSVPLAMSYIDRIVEGLEAARPEEAGGFRARGAAYKAKLDALDREIRTALTAIPAERRSAIVPHRAFAYYGQEYRIAFLSPLGTDADGEASAQGMVELVGSVRAGKVGAVFAEHLTGRRIVERIAEEAGIDVAGELYSDALSGAGGPAPTYIDLMRTNTRIIATGLMEPKVAHSGR